MESRIRTSIRMLDSRGGARGTSMRRENGMATTEGEGRGIMCKREMVYKEVGFVVTLSEKNSRDTHKKKSLHGHREKQQRQNDSHRERGRITDNSYEKKRSLEQKKRYIVL